MKRFIGVGRFQIVRGAVRSARPALAVASFLCLWLATATTAAAVPFVPFFFGGSGVPDQALITNLQWAQYGTNSYDAAAEKFTITLALTGIDYTTDAGAGTPGSTIIAQGDVLISIQATLSGSISNGSAITGNYTGGFSIIDTVGVVELANGTFDTGANLSLTGPVLFNGTLGGAYTSATATENVFFNAMTPTGDLTMTLANIFGSPYDGAGGLNAFVVNPTLLMAPDAFIPVQIPEPGTGMLVGIGLLLTCAARRRNVSQETCAR